MGSTATNTIKPAGLEPQHAEKDINEYHLELILKGLELHKKANADTAVLYFQAVNTLIVNMTAKLWNMDQYEQIEATVKKLTSHEKNNKVRFFLSGKLNELLSNIAVFDENIQECEIYIATLENS